MKRCFGMAGLLATLCIVAPNLADAASFEDVLRTATIAIELRGDRPAPYDFAGEVGSIRFNLEQGWIELITLSAGSKVSLHGEQFQITEIEKFPDSVDFTCIDQLGFAWRGKVFFSKEYDKMFGVELIRRASPRKIVNLSERGKQFLKEHGLNSLDLGV